MGIKEDTQESFNCPARRFGIGSTGLAGERRSHKCLAAAHECATIDLAFEHEAQPGICTGQLSPVEVSPASRHGWVDFDDSPGTGTGSGGFENGPGTAPLGAGSAFLRVDPTGRHALGTTAYVGTRMDSITELKYWSYQNNNTNTAAAISLQFDIDYDLNDADNSYMGRLVFEPYISNTVQQGVWQNWDALAGKWWGSRSALPPPITRSSKLNKNQSPTSFVVCS